MESYKPTHAINTMHHVKTLCPV